MLFLKYYLVSVKTLHPRAETRAAVQVDIPDAVRRVTSDDDSTHATIHSMQMDANGRNRFRHNECALEVADGRADAMHADSRACAQRRSGHCAGPCVAATQAGRAETAPIRRPDAAAMARRAPLRAAHVSRCFSACSAGRR